MPKFQVRKSILIAAPPEQVYATLRDFRRWPEWSPWLITEPETELTYSADGTRYAWNGKVTGSGEVAVVREDAPRSFDCRLTFLKPWKSVNSTAFHLTPKDGGTEVTWSMEGSLPIFMFWMKSMMTAFVGSDYQRGLMMLQSLMETGSVPSKLDFTGIQPFPGFRYIGVKRTCPIAEIESHMPADLEAITRWLSENKLTPTGTPFTSYQKWDPVRESTTYLIGLPVASPPATPPAGFVCGELPACQAFSIRHTGPYRYLGNAWSAGICRQRSKVISSDKAIHPFEIYQNDPAHTPENDLVTLLHFPVK